jgi:NhaA family Na+:H+ antiporter
MTPTRGWISDERLRTILKQVLSYPSGEHWSGDTTGRRDLQRANVATTETLSPLERLEIMLHPWVGFIIMPLFALANAGVTISGADIGQPASAAIFLGLVFGKPMGVIAFSWLAVRLGLATRAFDLNWPLVAAGSLLTGIGFTMSLFIAGLAYPPAMLDSAKIGILSASVVSAVSGLLILSWLTSRNRTA